MVDDCGKDSVGEGASVGEDKEALSFISQGLDDVCVDNDPAAVAGDEIIVEETVSLLEAVFLF